MQFWGGFFLFFCAYFWAGTAVETARLRARIRSGTEAASISIIPKGTETGHSGWFPGESADVRFSGFPPFRIWPGITGSMTRIFGSGSCKPFKIEAAIPFSKFSFVREVRVPRRGRWVSNGTVIGIGDILGLCRAETVVGSPAEFSVYPQISDNVPVPESHEGGETRRALHSWKRTDTFLDSRKYMPGDDPRRINWKQFARHGDLFVRLGEFHSPPEAVYTVLLDTTVPEGIHPSLADDWFDRTVSLCAGFVTENSGKGREIFLCVGKSGPESVSGFDALKRLADAERSGISPEFPAGLTAQGSFVAFTSAGSSYIKTAGDRASPSRPAFVRFCAPPGISVSSRLAAILRKFIFTDPGEKIPGTSYAKAKDGFNAGFAEISGRKGIHAEISD